MMSKRRPPVSLAILALLLLPWLGGACFLGPEDGISAIRFEAQVIDVDLGRDTVFQLFNDGSEAYGPVEINLNRLLSSGGAPAGGPHVVLGPPQLATLNPGDRRTIAATIVVPPGTVDDQYHAFVDAVIPDVGTVATVEIRFSVLDNEMNASVVSLDIVESNAAARQGDVLSFSTEALDAAGAPVPGARPRWSIVEGATAGYVSETGRFVAYMAGTVRVAAEAGAGADTVSVVITARDLTGSFAAVGQGAISSRFTSDLWVHGTAAYTGTWGIRSSAQGNAAGNTLHTWDITNPASPILTDSLTIDARTLNDVKVRASGDLGVITHERSNDGANGVTLLDLSDPLHPAVITRFTSTLTTGVHNAWIEGDYLYLVVDGTSPSSGLRILDISNPNQPTIVAQFYAGSSFLHDVYVRDGLAFLSHWNAGLIILDVGNGIAGGSPTAPVEVSRLMTSGGQAHNAWYWPDAGYVFVGEEDFTTPGIMHVVDVRDMRRPREVAIFSVMGDTPHNFWLDEENAVAYLAWYSNGIRAVDVSGDLLGALDQQGREISSLIYDGPLTRNWAPQLHNGLIYLADMNSGLRIVRLDN